MSHAQSNGTCYKEDTQEAIVSSAENTTTVTNTALVCDQSSSSYQMNKLSYTNSPYQSSSSSAHNAHQMSIHQHQTAHQTTPLHHNPMHQLNPIDQVVNPVHLANHVHQVAPMHQLNLTHQVNPVYQVNPIQFTRHLHHYNPTQVSGPTLINTSYPHASDALLHHYQPDHMHALHPQQVHYYNNSAYSFKH